MANDGTVKIGTELDDSGFKSGLSKLGSVASSALKGAVSIVGGVATAATGAAAGLLALESATEEYRIAQGKLNTAFEAAGYSAKTAQESYRGFYGILGDVDTATEASQLLSELALNSEDVSKWVDIAAGVYGKFGDSIETAGFIEAINQTQKLGEVNGTLADALEFVGITTDEFNAQLAECTTESQRNKLIMNTLSKTYDKAADAFYENNEALIESRNAQAQMDESLANLGESVSNVKNRLTSELLPAVSQITEGLAGMLAGTEGASEQFSEGIGNLISAAVSRLPEFLNFGVQIISAIGNGILQNLPALVGAGGQVIQQVANGILSAVSLLPDALSSVIDSIVSFFDENASTVLQQGFSFIERFTSGIIEAIPVMIERLPEIITAFVNFVTENFPAILETGVNLLEQFGLGILEAIPDFLEKLPQVITAFVNFITENLPKIINAGIEITINLGKGIIQAIPQIVARLPEIIAAIATGIVNLAESIIDIGVKIVGFIIDGIFSLAENLVEIGASIIGWIGDGIASLAETVIGWGGQIVEWVKSGVGSLWGNLVETGKNIVGGIWDGVKSAWTGFTDWVGSGINGLVSGVQGLLGIHSPSTVFRDKVGKNIGLGLAEGIEESIPAAEASMNKMSNTLVSAMPAAAISIRSANAAMTPSAVTSPRFTTENAVSQAAGMLAMANTGGSREVVFELNGTEVARAILPDLRAVEDQSPRITSD